MCKDCKRRGRKEFWIVNRFIQMQDFEREKETYEKLVLNLMEKTVRSIPVVDCVEKKFGIKIYQLYSDRDFLILFSRNHIKALCRTIMRDRYFWDHEIWPGLYLFVCTNDGLTIKKSKIALDLEENIDNIYGGKYSKKLQQ